MEIPPQREGGERERKRELMCSLCKEREPWKEKELFDILTEPELKRSPRK